MPYVVTSARRQMRTFYPPPYGFAAPRLTRRAFLGTTALGLRGLGDVSPTGAAASLLGSIAPFTGPAAPFVALGATLTGLFGQVFSGCGQTCTLTSDMANKMEGFLKQNLTLYQQSGHTQSEQAAALANFNNFWNQLVQYCGQASMGNAGERCISDRQAGACKWRDAAGACWNWWIGYHDPIANDPNVVADPVVSQSYTSLTPSGGVQTQYTPAGGSGAGISLGGFSLSPTALLAGAVVGALVILVVGGD